MDPRDHLRALRDGLTCTVCNEPVPIDRVRLLARRDDLAFIQVACGECGSTTLEFLADPAPSSVPAPVRPVISTDDVLSMHEFLDGWNGDVTTLLGVPQGGMARDRGQGG